MMWYTATHQELRGPHWWLLALWLLWAALLFGGFLFGTSEDANRMPAWTRLGSSLTLVVAGWSWFTCARHSVARRFSLLIAAGMTLGFVGDLFMAKQLPVSEPVLGGMTAFGLGHVAYIVALVDFGNQSGLAARHARWGAWIAWKLIGLVCWSIIVLPSSQAPALRWAALPYTLLLASTAGFATGLALQSRAFVFLALGSALFLLSDLILAAELFRQLTFLSIGDVVWLTYGPGQMLIVYAVASALKVAQGGLRLAPS